MPKSVVADVLQVFYEEHGPADGAAVFLLHRNGRFASDKPLLRVQALTTVEYANWQCTAAQTTEEPE